MRFVDTNVLLYAVSTAVEERSKTLVARKLLDADDLAEAARILGCRTVLSEDLAHGQDYDGVAVEDPFRPGITQE